MFGFLCGNFPPSVHCNGIGLFLTAKRLLTHAFLFRYVYCLCVYRREQKTNFAIAAQLISRAPLRHALVSWRRHTQTERTLQRARARTAFYTGTIVFSNLLSGCLCLNIVSLVFYTLSDV